MTNTSVVRDPMSGDDCENFKTIEYLFFAYRSFVTDADVVLAEYGFGRAHHRVLHFTNRVPGLTVAELLDILKITKQSLSRVLKELIETDHIVQLRATSDGRKRLLYPTKKGRKLALKLSKMQSQRIDTAFGDRNRKQIGEIEDFLHQMIDHADRIVLDQILRDRDPTLNSDIKEQ